jgi:hypothetical protein
MWPLEMESDTSSLRKVKVPFDSVAGMHVSAHAQETPAGTTPTVGSVLWAVMTRGPSLAGAMPVFHQHKGLCAAVKHLHRRHAGK